MKKPELRGHSGLPYLLLVAMAIGGILTAIGKPEGDYAALLCNLPACRS